MPLFPFFINIEGAEGLIIGGSKHALEKIGRLKPYGPKLTVIAEEFLPEIENDREVKLIHRKFEETDLEAIPAFVIVAGEDMEENHRIAELCREKRILVNVVDDQPYCDFIFPSLISHGSLSVGICTNGASPATGVLLKRKMEAQIPERIEEILDFLQKKRPAIAQAFSDKKKRFAFYYQLSELCMSENRPMTEEEFKKLIENNMMD